MARLTDDLARSVHQIAWELRPSVLDDLGLSRALRRYLTGWSKMTQVPVDFQCSGLRGLKRAKPVVEITLYRIAQEALQNVWKHSRARRVSVLLQRRTEDVLLIVEDDGQGFNADNLLKDNRRGQLGLTGMYERAALVGGNVAIESRPRKGTCIFVSIPLPADLNVAASRQSAAISRPEDGGALPRRRYGSGVQSAKSAFGEFLSGKS